jgi:DNA repair protein SbcD/Mre11
MKIVLTADWHIRDSVPACRSDDFLAVQRKKLQYFTDMCKTRKVDLILHAGDLFDKARPVHSQMLEMMIREYAGQWPRTVVIPGNHDMPYHSYERMTETSSLGVLFNFEILMEGKGVDAYEDEKVKVFYFPYGFDFDEHSDLSSDYFNIAVWHGMVTNCGSQVFDSYDGKTILENLRYDLILTGHNHKKFIVHGDHDRYLVNPGGLTRQSIDEENSVPSFFMIDTNTRVLEQFDIPVEKDVFTFDTEVSKERDEKIRVFIESMSNSYSVGIDFEKNMETFLGENKLDEKVKNFVMEALYE